MSYDRETPAAVWVCIGIWVVFVIGLTLFWLDASKQSQHQVAATECKEADAFKACVRHALDLKMRDVLSQDEMSDYHSAVHDYVNFKLNTIKKDCFKEQ